ncbi:MAG: four helix bundle protein [Acidobacteria bacterium]|nr:four helix bundle protein [Acidobacteriota bacterium]MBI3485118.1 four helix bundle protein [Acidobacteriota bacterium]
MNPSAKAVLKSYRDLLVWQKSMDLAAAVYQAAKLLPSSERFGLVTQMQRAAVSVVANIAEGYGRSHRGDYLHHLSIANGSLKEVETHLLLSVRLGHVEEKQIEPALELASEVGRMLSSLMQKLKVRSF